MKLKDFILLLMILIPMSFTSCDKGEYPELPPDINDLSGTFSNKSDADKNKLILTFDGKPLTGKEVIFKSYNNETGKIELYDIIEGEKIVTISNVPLTINREKGGLDFSGVYTTSSSAKVKYSGNVTYKVTEEKDDLYKQMTLTLENE
ncbi:MAG: DUF4925 domain-containing protein [Tannerellaceae bacterium]